MTKVLLINPSIDLYPGELVSVIQPLGLAYIAAVLEKEGHQVNILDCLALGWRKPIKVKRNGKPVRRLSPGEDYISKYIKEFGPQIIGISNLVTPTEKETLQLAALVKRLLPRVPVVVGGANASLMANLLIKDKNIDFVVVGEGENTMKELVSTLEKKKSLHKINGLVFKEGKKVVVNPKRELIKNLDELPFPAWHLLPMEEYFHGQPAGLLYKNERFGTVLTSRGCPNSCSFCTNEAMWSRNWRARNVENVMKEIRLLKEIYGIKEVQFIDSNMSVDKNRFKMLCQELFKEKMYWYPGGGIAVLTIDLSMVSLIAKSGCYAFCLGIEHGDFGMQKRIGKVVPLEATKKLVAAGKKEGIWMHGNFIVGLPGETKETARKSLEYAIEADLDAVSFFTALPLPGSRVYKELVKKTKIDADKTRFYITKVSCSDLSSAQIDKIVKESFKKFLKFRVKKEFTSLQFIQRIARIRSLGDVGFYIRYLKRFISLN